MAVLTHEFLLLMSLPVMTDPESSVTAPGLQLTRVRIRITVLFKSWLKIWYPLHVRY